MAHPYFDAARYPWHRRDAQVLYEQLCPVIRDFDDIDLLLKSCSPDLYELVRDRPSLMWKNALDMAAAAGMLKTLLLRLRERQFPKIQAAIAAIEAAEDDLADIDLFIRCESIVVDRAALHARIRQLGDGRSDLRVLLVRGGQKSGTSWVRHLAQAHARELGHDCLYLGTGLVASADDALRLIFSRIGAVPESRTTEQAAFAAACRALAEHYAGMARQCWIVVDDLGERDGAPRLDPQIRELCEQIALQMQDGAVARQLRLILLDYPDRPPPTRWNNCWGE